MRAAVSERDVATNLPEAGPPPPGLLADKGFNGEAFAVSGPPRHRRAGPATKGQRRGMTLEKIIAEWRIRVEATLARSPT